MYERGAFMSDMLSQEEIDNLVAKLFEELGQEEEKEPAKAKPEKTKKASKVKYVININNEQPLIRRLFFIAW